MKNKYVSGKGEKEGLGILKKEKPFDLKKKKKKRCAPSSSLFFSLARGFSSAREE